VTGLASGAGLSAHPLWVILLLAAVILFGLAAFGIGGARVNLVALGLGCWALETLLALGGWG